MVASKGAESLLLPFSNGKTAVCCQQQKLPRHTAVFQLLREDLNRRGLTSEVTNVFLRKKTLPFNPVVLYSSCGYLVCATRRAVLHRAVVRSVERQVELEPPAELVVQEGLDHGLAVLPGWHSFDVSALHSPAQDVPEMDRQTDRLLQGLQGRQRAQ